MLNKWHQRREYCLSQTLKASESHFIYKPYSLPKGRSKSLASFNLITHAFNTQFFIHFSSSKTWPFTQFASIITKLHTHLARLVTFTSMHFGIIADICANRSYLYHNSSIHYHTSSKTDTYIHHGNLMLPFQITSSKPYSQAMRYLCQRTAAQSGQIRVSCTNS